MDHRWIFRVSCRTSYCRSLEISNLFWSMSELFLTPEQKKDALEVKFRLFRKDLEELKAKHGLDIMPCLQYHEGGILPVIRLVEKQLDKDKVV